MSFFANCRLGAALPSLLLPLCLAGCVDRPGVTSYTVQNVAPDRPKSSATMAEAAQPGQAWFFKLLGKQAAVQSEADAFARLMATVRFDDRGLPAWDTPAGWTERKEQGMRFATLVRDGTEPPLEIAVSALPSDDPGSDAYLKSNIDRWRGQVGLEPYTGNDWKSRAEAAGEVHEAEGKGGRFVLVQLAGKDPKGEALTMLAAIVPRGGAVASAAPSSVPSAPVSDAAPKWTAPAEWTSEPPRQFQTALWTVANGDQKVEISVSQSGGSLDANLARWRTQVGPDPAGNDEPAQESLTIGGASATRVELKGTEKSILGVIVPQGDRAWFFKMMGSSALVDQERARFQSFVESVQLP
jgi:hypothetical protein